MKRKPAVRVSQLTLLGAGRTRVRMSASASTVAMKNPVVMMNTAAEPSA